MASKVELLKARLDELVRGFLFCGLLLLIACGKKSTAPQATHDYELNASAFDQAHLRLVEEKSGIQFPKEAIGKSFFWLDYAIDPSFLAKISIADGAVASIRDELRALPDEKIGSDSVTLTSKVDWWKPTAPEVDRSFARTGCYVRVMLCKEDGEWRVYVMWASV